jgi:DNA-binding transcriptional ArsR family regulator
MKRLLWWLIAGSRGGANRAVMIRALKERPYNAHQLSETLKLDYKTVRHHLKVLAENNVVVSAGKEQYGTMWFLSPMMESHYADFLDILAQVKLDGA